MLDIPGKPELDKGRLVGACARLPVHVDHSEFAQELQRIPPDSWVARVGRHHGARAVYLRGRPPAEGDCPVEDSPLLSQMPQFRALIHATFDAPPLRCLIATLPPGGVIAPHIDQGPYFRKTLRLHVPIRTNPNVWIYCAGLSYRMQAGEVWTLNNSAVHGVWNADALIDRTHLICDFLPSPALIALLQAADRALGQEQPGMEERLLVALRESKRMFAGG